MTEPIDVLGALRAGGAQNAFEFVEWRGREALGANWSRTDLAERAAYAARIISDVSAPGDRVVIAAPPGPAFVAGLFGCFASGRIAAPAKAPVGADAWRRTFRLARACGASAIIARADAGAEAAGPATAQIIAPELLLYGRDTPNWAAPSCDRIAYLQFTSGSTGAPRGVVVTFGALAANLAAMRACWNLGAHDIGVYWLPPHHDMGLVGGVLAPVALGFPSVLMHPSAFLQRPERWASLIARRRATFSGGPDFAFDILAEAAHRLPGGTDLSAWRVAVNGAEPVRRRTLRRVAEALAGFGFDPDALCPGYGLAEAVLFVAARAPGEPSALEGGDEDPVGCGRPYGDSEIAIVDPLTRARVDDGAIGEIWVNSPRALGPYWGASSEVSGETFAARLVGEATPWLRTGDLGGIRAGALVVSGRLKDIVSRRGRKAHAADLEASIRSALAAPSSLKIAVVAVGSGSIEQLIAVVETRERLPDPLAAVADAAHSALAALDFAADHLLLVRPGAVPVTSSGKIAKGELRTAYLAGALVDLRAAPSLPAAASHRRHVA